MQGRQVLLEQVELAARCALHAELRGVESKAAATKAKAPASQPKTAGEHLRIGADAGHAPAEGGRWVIDAVRPYVPAGGTVVTGWLDATSLAYGAYADRSLPGRIIVSDNQLRVALYQRWAKERPVFVLVDPHTVRALPGARDYARLDAYHELYTVERP